MLLESIGCEAKDVAFPKDTSGSNLIPEIVPTFQWVELCNDCDRNMLVDTVGVEEGAGVGALNGERNSCGISHDVTSNVDDNGTWMGLEGGHFFPWEGPVLIERVEASMHWPTG